MAKTTIIQKNSDESTNTEEQLELRDAEKENTEPANEQETADDETIIAEEPSIPAVSVHNSVGHRCFVRGPSGVVTTLSDETAATLALEPYQISYLFDGGNSRSIHVSQFVWCDSSGAELSGRVGQRY